MRCRRGFHRFFQYECIELFEVSNALHGNWFWRRSRKEGKGGGVGICYVEEELFERVNTWLVVDDYDGLLGWGFCYGLLLFWYFWREWMCLAVRMILIGFPSFQMRIVRISVLAHRLQSLKWRWMSSEEDEDCVWHKERSRMPLFQILVFSKGSDVYWWERDEVSTSSDCDRLILVVECLWKIHVGESGHV